MREGGEKEEGERGRITPAPSVEFTLACIPGVALLPCSLVPVSHGVPALFYTIVGCKTPQNH